MVCVACLEINRNTKDLYNDCVIECIEKLKTHYLYLKSQLHDQVQNIQKLQAKNNELVTRLTELSPKRRKTNSFDESPHLHSEKSASDCLNDAIQADLSDDSFFHGTQKQQQPGSTPKNVLRLSNQQSDQNTPPYANASQLSAVVLPRRIKSSPKEAQLRPPLAVLKTPTSSVAKSRTSKWTTKTSEKQNQSRHEINFSFIQPLDVQKRAAIVSPKIAKSPGGERGNLLTLNKEVNLKQSRLRFDVTKRESEQETIIPETDDTFCDMIAASPTPHLLSETDASKRKLRSIRKFSRCRPNSMAETSRKIPLDVIIKAEPQSAVKKVINFDSKAQTLPPIISPKVVSSDASTVSGIEPIADASVCFLPSQSDDVIIVDDSNTDSNLNIDSAALFDEMMLRSDETSDFLKGIEKKCISKLKDKKSKENETAKSSIAGSVSKADLKWSCKDCEKYYTMAARIIPKDELEKRLKHCQNNHGQANFQTPEGFWNPQFPPTPDDDPRYQTLVDTRIQFKKKD